MGFQAVSAAAQRNLEAQHARRTTPVRQVSAKLAQPQSSRTSVRYTSIAGRSQPTGTSFAKPESISVEEAAERIKHGENSQRGLYNGLVNAFRPDTKSVAVDEQGRFDAGSYNSYVRGSTAKTVEIDIERHQVTRGPDAGYEESYEHGYQTGKGYGQDIIIGAATGIAGKGISAGLKATDRVWDLGWQARGLKIEDRLGGNLVANFPTIDKFKNGVATSIKSVDLNAKTYQDMGKLRSKLKGYANSASNFDGATRSGQTILDSQIKQRSLEIAVPPGRSAEQQRILAEIASYGAKLNPPVKVTIKVIR